MGGGTGDLMKRRTFLTGGTAAALALPFAFTARAQQFPVKPVRLVVPFATGQGSDILARAIAEKLHAQWGKPVIVDNKAGANGSIAASEVVRNADDGHTILVTSNSPMVINPNLYKALSYDVERDLKPVILLSTTDVGLMVNPKLPANNIDELIALLKSEPGKYSYGSIGMGSTSHLAMETFKRATGTDIVHVPYRGSSLAMTDLISGNIQLMFDGLPSSVPHVKSGRIRSLAVSGTRHSRFLPDAPVLGDIGIHGTPNGGWYGVMVGASVDDAVAAQLNAAFRNVLEEPGIRQQLTELSMDAALPPMSQAEFRQFIEKETAYWKGVTTELGIYQSA